MSTALITGDYILTGFASDGTPVLHQDAALLVIDGRVAALGPLRELRRVHPEVPEHGGRGRIVIPGLINAHHHVGLTPFQLGARDQPLELWFAERLRMRDVDPWLDTLYSGFEMVASGVTCVQHLHSRAAGDIDRVISTAESIIGAYEALGMRASYSFAMRDQNRMIYAADENFISRLPVHLRDAMASYLHGFALPLEDQIAVFHHLNARWPGDGRIAIQIAPSNLHWLSDVALDAAARLYAATGAPMHMHLLETPYQKEYARRRTGGSALDFIDQFGLVGPQLTIGHGVWMTDDDLALLAERGGCLCHNCSSNMRLKSGTADLNSFLATGLPVALGIDEAGLNDDRDMLQEMRLAMTLHRPAGHESRSPSAAQILQMATSGGAATTPFGARIGQLQIGCAADVVILDWQKVTWPWQDPELPLVDVLIRRAKAGAVETVMVAGETIYHMGDFTRIARDQILEEIASRLRAPLSGTEETRRSMALEVMDHVAAFYCDWKIDT